MTSAIGSVSRVDRDSGSTGIEDQAKRADANNGPTAQKTSPRNEKVDGAAKMYEKAFLSEMVKAMRQTVDFGAQKPSMGENIYREELDQQYVDSWGEKGGIGLADLIYNQIMERYFNSESGQAVKKEGGGIPLTDRDVSRVIRVKTADAPGQVPLRVELKKTADGSPAKVQAPWAGEVVSNIKIEGGKTALTLKHGPNLRSTLVFNGVTAAQAQPGAKLEKGDVVGILSPEIHSFLWNINRTGTDAPEAASKAEAVSAPLDSSRVR